MYRLAFAALSAALPLSAQTVPPLFQDLYDTLTTQVSSFDSAVRAGWNGSKSPVLYAPQLVGADSGQYTGLLAPYYYSNVVLPQLQELQAMGATAVTVHISFPILYQPFYSADPSQYQLFVDFYRQLALDIRARGLKLIVESVTSTPFPGNKSSAFTDYYKSLTWSAYMTGRARNALNVAQLIVPDYMSVITEPDTELSNTGQTNAGTVSGSTQLLQNILSALQSAGVTQLPIGAGTGTWIPSFTDYIQSFAATSVQYIDLHIYPVNNDDFMNALTIADSIHAAGKQIAISEAWVYKVRDSELGRLTSITLYARDPFSFWGPVDIAFLQALVDFANAKQLTFLSPFWNHYFAAYLDYNLVGALTSRKILDDSNTAANDANLAGVFTPTGLAWQASTTPAPDFTPPATPSAPVSTVVYPTTIPLTWSASTDNVGVAATYLYRNGTLLGTTSLLGYNDQGLTPGATYTYTLKAFDSSGNVSPASPPLTVQTMNTTPPSVPTNVKVTETTKNSVSLVWSPSTGIGGVGGYRILRGASRTSMSIHGSSLTTAYTDPLCSASTRYYYSVESYNPLGIASNPSSTVVATTLSR